MGRPHAPNANRVSADPAVGTGSLVDRIDRIGLPIAAAGSPRVSLPSPTCSSPNDPACGILPPLLVRALPAFGP
eukprot:8690674-Pyramimonas_sp.AAC.1